MAKSKSELNDFVASFRIPKALKTKIEEWLKLHPVTGCKSANQYLRKIAIDKWTPKDLKGPSVFDGGAAVLEYTDPNDNKESPEIAAAKRQILAAQPPVTAG